MLTRASFVAHLKTVYQEIEGRYKEAKRTKDHQEVQRLGALLLRYSATIGREDASFSDGNALQSELARQANQNQPTGFSFKKPGPTRRGYQERRGRVGRI